MNAIYGWLTEASQEQKRTLLAAFLGYMLDSMDVMLYALVLGQVQREMHLSAALSGAMMSATLIAAAFGGVGFGWFADRFGRVRALTLSVLVYSIGHGAVRFHADSHTADALPRAAGPRHGRRMGFGRRPGGGDVAGAAPGQSAGIGAKLVGGGLRAGRSRGRAGDAALRMACRVLRRDSSRAGFALGAERAARAGGLAPGAERTCTGRPALPRCVRLQHAGVRQHERRGALRLVGTLHLATSFLSMPIAEGGRGLSIVQTSAWTIVMQTGTFLGYIAFGFLADRFSRKYTYIGFLVVAALLVPLFAFVRNPNALLLIGPLVGFFGTGYFSGFSVIASELFPTALRALCHGLRLQHRPRAQCRRARTSSAWSRNTRDSAGRCASPQRLFW